MWWLCTSCVFIDTSAPEGYEEEEYYPEAEEEGIDQYQNQGKLLLLAELYHTPSFILLCFSKASYSLLWSED